MHRSRGYLRLGLACALAACVAFVLPAAAGATTLERFGVESLVAKSSTVVLAQVAGMTPRTTADGAIVTDVDLVVSKAFKGAPGPMVRITVAGGALSGRRMMLEGEATFAVGERCFVFLDANGRVVGGWQGKIDVAGGEVTVADRAFTSARISQSEAAFADYLRDVNAAGLRPAASFTAPDLSEGAVSPLDVPLHTPRRNATGVSPAYTGVWDAAAPADFETGIPWWMDVVGGPVPWAVSSAHAATGSWSLYNPATGATPSWIAFQLSTSGAQNVAYLDMDVLTDLQGSQYFFVDAFDYATKREGFAYFTGRTHGWEHFEVDLSHMADAKGALIDMSSSTQLQVALLAGREGVGSGEGVYVDNLRFSKANSAVPIPAIGAVAPAVQAAGVGATITITGTNFGTDPGKLTFFAQSYHQRIDAAPLSWTDSRIVAEVPVGMIGSYKGSVSSGPLSVTRADGRRSNPAEFRVTFGADGAKWPSPLVPYRINEGGTPGRAAAVRAAAATWSRPGSFELTETAVCATADTVAPDGFNDVYWTAALPPGYIAATFLTETSGTTIVERDIAFSKAYAWGDAKVSAGVMDVQTIALHELGHWVGLRDLYGPYMDSDKVMFGYGTTGEVFRSLGAGDIRGRDFLYGCGMRAQTKRMGGWDRYDVAVNIAADVYPGWKGVKHVIVTSGEDRAAADPLAAAGLAGAYRAPVLLTRALTLNGYTSTAIAAIARANPGLRVHIVGGTGSVSAATARQIAVIPGVASVDRVAGADRYSTAAAVADRMKLVLGTRMPKIALIANGGDPTKFYDPLAASPISARIGAPILLVSAVAVPYATSNELKKLGITVGNRVIVGNTAAVSEPVRKYLGVPTVNRWYGADRCGTAYSVARHARTLGWLNYGITGVTNKLPDAVTGGSAMGLLGGPILFTPAATLDANTRTAITLNSPEILGVTVFGGSASVSDGVVSSIGGLLQ